MGHMDHMIWYSKCHQKCSLYFVYMQAGLAQIEPFNKSSISVLFLIGPKNRSKNLITLQRNTFFRAKAVRKCRFYFWTLRRAFPLQMSRNGSKVHSYSCVRIKSVYCIVFIAKFRHIIFYKSFTEIVYSEPKYSDTVPMCRVDLKVFDILSCQHLKVIQKALS